MEGPEEAKKNQEEVKPEILGFTVQGIRETRSKDLLVDLKFSKEDRGHLDSAFKGVIDSNCLFVTSSTGLRWRLRTSILALKPRISKRV